MNENEIKVPGRVDLSFLVRTIPSDFIFNTERILAAWSMNRDYQVDGDSDNLRRQAERK